MHSNFTNVLCFESVLARCFVSYYHALLHTFNSHPLYRFAVIH